jgi:hypothetical protein
MKQSNSGFFVGCWSNINVITRTDILFESVIISLQPKACYPDQGQRGSLSLLVKRTWQSRICHSVRIRSRGRTCATFGIAPVILHFRIHHQSRQVWVLAEKLCLKHAHCVVKNPKRTHPQSDPAGMPILPLTKHDQIISQSEGVFRMLRT